MLRGYLVVDKGGPNARRVPIIAPLVVGRTDECDLMIDDPAASRQHVEAYPGEDAFYWKDLGSTNGTLINGLRMLKGELKDGDKIEIGETVLHFEVEEIPEPTSEETTRTSVRTPFDGVTASDSRKPEELLQAVYSVMNATATIYEPCALVDRILETTVRAISAQRGAIFFGGDPEQALGPCPVCGHVHVIHDGQLQRADTGEIRISSTVARRVLGDGQSVLFQNTDEGDSLDMAESIMSLRLRSIICAPLRAKLGILGILYIDTDRDRHQYTHDDMLLSTSVGNIAGIALENANMHKQLLDKQRIDQEIQHAWTIQEGFLVKDWPNEDPRFEVYGETRPAKTVGGDFYDFVRPDKGHVGLLIGDVSGKGIPAALAMAQLLAAFRLYARGEESPAKVLGALNADLVVRSQRGMFCSMFYLKLDTASGEVCFANAGHAPAVHVGPGKAVCFGNASGPPTGIMPEAPWVESTWTVKPGDSLLLYTDGITEARSGRTQRGVGRLTEPDEYGTEELCHFAKQLYGQPARKLVEGINRDVGEFCAPSMPHDDCTMIALRYLGETTRHSS